MSRKIIKQTEKQEAYLSVSYKAAGDSTLPLLSANADKNLFEMFMANSQTGSWVYDENNIIVFANKAYTESTNFEGDPTGLHLSASWATTRFAVWSLTGPTRKITRSLSGRE